MKLKLRSSVSVIDRKDNVIEFFKTNTREQVMIRSHNSILKDFLSELDGTFSLEEYIQKHNLHSLKEDLSIFVKFLQNKGMDCQH